MIKLHADEGEDDRQTLGQVVELLEQAPRAGSTGQRRPKIANALLEYTMNGIVTHCQHCRDTVDCEHEVGSFDGDDDGEQWCCDALSGFLDEELGSCVFLTDPA